MEWCGIRACVSVSINARAEMNAYARREARALLTKGPPFAGDSSFKNKQKVKEIGGEHIKWDSSSKKWCAQTETAMFELIDEDVWFPLGPDGTPLSHEAGLRLRDERRAMDKEDYAANAAQREAEAAQAAARLAALEARDLQIQPDEPELLAEAAEHGVTAEMIEATTRWMELGPRTGLSNVGRIKRGIDLNLLEWRHVREGAQPRRGKTSQKSEHFGSDGGGHAAEAPPPGARCPSYTQPPRSVLSSGH